jgi:hypothetical protein
MSMWLPMSSSGSTLSRASVPKQQRARRSTGLRRAAGEQREQQRMVAAVGDPAADASSVA